jgi:hypothetical protein
MGNAPLPHARGILIISPSMFSQWSGDDVDVSEYHSVLISEACAKMIGKIEQNEKYVEIQEKDGRPRVIRLLTTSEWVWNAVNEAAKYPVTVVPFDPSASSS